MSNPIATGAKTKINALSARLIKISERWKPITLKGIQIPIENPTLVKNMSKSMYILSMFPYPSGMLHMGHLRVYVISDSLNRFYQQQGHKVIHPMGWDAFGLPAENAAIERGINPRVWTEDNIKKMKGQMNNMLANFSWDREVRTCDPEYYKFTQWIFLKMYENKLAYRKEAEINWDPVDKTVLANEQVDAQGRSWRSGAVVEKKKLNQWFLKITDFTKQLNNDLNTLKNWPDHVKAMQKHWIGESIGSQVVYDTNNEQFSSINVFTTRIETLFAVQFVALSSNHPIVTEYMKTIPDLKKYIDNISNLPRDSKSGFMIPNLKVTNPLTHKEVPVFVAPYVIGTYTTGNNAVGAAVMGVPGHDERDFKFWKQNMPESSPILTCVNPLLGTLDKVQMGEIEKLPFIGPGIMGKLAGPEYFNMSSSDAASEIVQRLQSKKLAKSVTNYKLRDWLISRQRYWGTPIPMIHCDNCGTVPVPEKDLPVILPDTHELSSRGGNPLAKIPEFVNVKCPSCGSDAKRETDTMDTFIDSSWYYFRYLDSKNKDLPFSYEKASANMPVNIYIGGVEHAILHLLYSRFVSKFLGSINTWDGISNHFEPFGKLVTQGMVHGKTFVDPDNGKFLKPDELESDGSKMIVKATGKEPTISYEKMSKSKFNGADPDTCISQHGPDATRAHILFQSPIQDVLRWDESKIIGIERWMQKVLKLAIDVPALGQFNTDYETPEDLTEHEVLFHNDFQKYHRSITDAFEKNLSLNTVISDYMKISIMFENLMFKKCVRHELLMHILKKFVTMLYPILPSLCEESANIIKEKQPGLTNWNHYAWPKKEQIAEWALKRYQVVINGKAKFWFVSEKDLFKKGNDFVYEYLLNHEEGRPYLVNRTFDKLILKNNIVSVVFKKKIPKIDEDKL